MTFWKTITGDYVNPETGASVAAYDNNTDGAIWYINVAGVPGAHVYQGNLALPSYETQEAAQADIQILIDGIDPATLL